MKKVIAIDMRYVENPYSGLSRFSINIFKSLIKNSKNEDLFFIVLLPPINVYEKLGFFNNIDKSKIQYIFSKKERGLRWKIPFFIFDLKLYQKLKKLKVDLFLSPYIDPPILPGIKVISTIHDLIFIRVRNYFNNFRFIKRSLSELRIILTILYSNNILSVSQTTKDLLVSRYKFLPFLREKLNDITVIYNGIINIKETSQSCINKDLNFNGEYFLYVGDRRNHKNLFYTIELIENYNFKFNKNFYLFIAGSISYKNFNLTKFINSKPFVKEIINPNDELLDKLYRNCVSLILLSFEEGFGIPVIEALSRSSKVVLSDIKIFREIGSNYALFLNHHDKKQHLNMLHDYLNQEVKVDPQIILKKWSWDLSSIKLKKFLLSQLLSK